MEVELNGKWFTLRESCADDKEAFECLARWGETFGQSTCGACDGVAIFTHRTPQNYHYYSMRCIACGAELHFGQRQSDGLLFPKRKDKEGAWLPNNGWVKRDQLIEEY